MKHTLKQALALFIAVLLATLGPVGALSEGIELEQVVSENIEPPVEEAGPFELGDLQLDDGGVSLQEGLTLSYDEAPEDIGGEAVLELGDTEAETPVVEETEPTEPFDQAVTIDGAVIAVTAEAGVFPEGAALRVEAVNSEADARAVEAAVGVEGVYVHRQYRVEIVDGANNVILPDYEQGVPAVRVEGLDLPAGSRVAVYDETVPGAYEIDARVNEGAIVFELVDVGIYDIFTIEPPTEAQEEAPAEGETEEPAQQPAEGETEESAQQPTEGETEEPTEQSAEGDAEEPAEGETEEPAEQPAEGEAEESTEGETEEESTDEVIEEPVEVEGEAIQPVSVVFDAMPETAVVMVWPAATEEVPVPEAIPAQEDGSFALLPGEYTYSAEADGYVSLENVPFTVMGDEQPLLLSFALEAVPEPVAFDQSQTVNGVIVTVKAEPGVFPEGAELSVKRVPVYKQRQADAAVEEVRDENQNVAVSYTFDIKVIDPATREELQPAEGQTVSVSFALAEVADENLETSVYHIDDSGAAEKLDVTQEDEVTASVETEGFSLYTVEFTYNTLEYVLPGDSSVPMSEILTTLGLAGEVTAVEISDTSLFSASNETGEWIVTAHQAFDTTEWMKVTINGVVYEIRVTDDGSGLAAIGYLYYADEAAAIAGNTTTGSCTDYTVITDQTAWGEAGQDKWYVVNSNVTIADRITVSGNVHLILSDGCTLTASKGIGVTNGNSLTIYGQSANESTMGAIDAQLGINSVYNYLAAIGGGGSQNSSGQITVNGGKIIATGGTNAAGIGGGKDESGTVTINGGFITATSQYNNATPGAAIGGGNNGSGTVTINGGHIVATGGQSAAGIGSGYAASATVTINGGIIEAHGGAGAAGIGSGKYWNDSSTTRQATVYIHGGTVTADTKSPMYNTDGSAAIGGGAHSQGFVTIDGGHVTATAPKNCTCIGNYEVNYRQTGSVTITGGVVIAQLDSSVQASDTYYGIGGAECIVTLGWTNESDSIASPAWGKQGNNIAPRDNGVTFVDGKSFQYQDTHALAEAASLRDGATLIPFTSAAQQSVDQADVSGVRAWYPYTGSAIEPEPVVTYAGTALTKETDYTLSYTSDHTSIGEKAVTITGKGNYTGTKTIYYQIVEASTTYLDDTGTSQTCTTFQCLDQSDTTLSAGWYLVYDDLTIDDRINLSGDVNLILGDSKTLTAQKGISVPSSASLTIYAQSNSESTAGKLETGAPDVSYPGIGGPYQANTAVTPGNITVVGGVINATGGVGASAIGGATYSPGGNITIKGGFVTATSSVGGGAAIGGGANADGGTINITGGKVTATGNGGAAIGGGSSGKSGTINISGGTVTATADGCAAIGGGSNGAGETINITGGTITATNSGETGGAAIGGGINAAGGKITIENATIAKATASAGAGIGSGGGETAGTTTVIIGTGAIISNAGSYNGAGIGSGQNSSTSCSVTIQSGANVKAGSTLGAGIGGGNGASNFSVTIQGGTVNAWAGGIGTQDGNGNLSAYGGAAIGGGANTSGGNVSISGGTVTARAIGGGAGIGSGANTSTSATTDSGTITISGGTVTAAATHRAAGIGGGRRSNGGTITINGGTITANGSDAAGIGHGGEDTLWEGQGSFHISIIDDPTQDVGGAWYDSIVPIDGTNIATTDGTVTFTYTDTVSITASSYPAAVTLDNEFMYSDTGEKVNGSSITAEKTLVPYSNHVHSFTYSAEGATLTATCNTSGCILVDHKATLTINAPAELIYDGTAKAVTVIGEIPGVTTPTITYTRTGDDTFTGMPTNAGSYIASITVEGATASVSYAIAPKPVTVTAKAQSVAIGGSIATGMDQATLTGALDGHTLTSVTLTSSSTEAATTEGTITPSVATVMNGETDVTANYNISYENGVLTVMPVVTFDSNGGSAVDTQTVNPGSKATKPSDPTNGNARFMGWYKVTNGQTADTEFDFNTAINENTALKAKWGYEITPQYNVLGSISFISGMVESNGYYGIVGENVVLSLTPNEGCLLTGLTNNDEDVMGSVVNGRYTFTMPSGDVTVSATFKQLYTVSVSKNALISQTFTVDGQEVTPTDADEYNMTLQIPAGAEVSITAAPVDSSEYRIEGIDIRREDTHDHFGTVTDGENGARTATFTMVEAEVYVHVNVVETGWHVYTGVPVYDGEKVIFKVTATPHHGEAGTPITLTVEKADDVTLGSMAYVYNDKAAGEEITVSLTPDADGKYTFTMPDSWVRVEPKYYLTRKHQIINRLGDGPSVCLVFQQDEYNTNLVETTTANAGDTVRVYPNGGTLQDFKVNGTEVKVSGYESDPYYEFTMPDEDATLTGSVTYSLQTYWVERGTVTVQVGDGEVIEMSGGTSLSIPASAQVTVTATPDAGYNLYRLSYRMDDRYGRGSDEKGGVEIQSGVPFTMPGGNIVIDAEFNTPWNHLRNQIDNARDGDTITLTEDATAPAGEGCLGISYKSITVDLNGHTINRNLTAPTDYGCVISVDSSAALTLLDSKGGGKITGGNNNYNGGGIAVAGTLNLQGGKITGNSASDGGGVAVISSGAVFNLTGGEISGNANTSSRSSAGVLYTSGAMNVSGSPVVTDAVYVDLNRKLHVTGALTNATPIPVIIAGGVGVPFTDGLPNNGSAANFKSADDDYRVRVNADGEAELYAPTFYNVTFDPDNGDEPTTQPVAENETAARPEDPMMEGYAFMGWYLNETEFDFDTPINEDIELTAEWQPGYLITLDVTGNGRLIVDTGSGQGEDAPRVLAAERGQQVTVTVAPDAKHMVVYDEETCWPVTVTDGDGEPVGVNYDPSSIDTFTFVMPASPVTVSAEFVEAEYAISIQYTADSGFYEYYDGIAVTVNGEPAKVDDDSGYHLAKPDQTVALDVTPAPGYALVEITGRYRDWEDPRQTLTINQSADDPNHWTFTMPDGTPTLTAQFRKLPAATFMDGETVYTTLYPDPANLLTRPDDPTKEGHRFLGWYQDDTEFDFDTPITEDITLTAHWQKVCTVIINADAGCVVTVTADYSEENGGTPVASGDIVEAGTVLTVAARARAGYRLTTTPEASYTVNDDLTITAASEALTYTLTLTHENGAAPTFTGTDSLTAVPYGAKVTVTAEEANEGFEFVGWYQTNGVQLVTDNTMTITVTGNSEYLARYQEKSCVVTFMANGQSIKTMTSAASITEADLPTNANEYACTGYVFTGWDKTVSEINVALGNGNNVTVTANYAPKPADITVTVYNGNSEKPTTQTLTESKYISITAETVEGMVLAYWTMDDEIVTYNKKCTVRVTRDCILRAVYSTEATEAIGTATIQTVNYNADAKKLTFVAYLTVPDGCKITAMGIVANNAEAGNDPKYGSATFTKDYAKSHGTSIPWTYTWNKTNVSIGDIWYARAYVFYNDTNGTNHEVYGSLITTNAGTNYDYTEKGTAKIIGTSYNADAKKASFVAYLNIPEGGVISKAGLVASSSVNYNPSSNGMLIADNAQYVKAYAKATGTSIPWTYTWNKTNVNSGDIWYARAYLVYTLNGIERTVYGDLVTYTAP